MLAVGESKSVMGRLSALSGLLLFFSGFLLASPVQVSQIDKLPPLQDSSEIMGLKIDPNSFRCEDFIPKVRNESRSKKHAAPVVMEMTWQETVEIENCDRIKRLAKLTEAQASMQPDFYVSRIPKEKLPPNFPDIPMLRVVFPQNVFFDTAKSELRPEAVDVVNLVAAVLRTDVPDVTLFVAGHTDSNGNRDYNQNLSVDRANSVAAQLLALDVGLAHVWRIGFGEDMPLVPNVDAEAMGHNRRVEFLLAAKPEAISQWLADMQLDGLCQGSTSEETENCKKNLVLKPQYDVGEIAINPAAQVDVSTGKKTRAINFNAEASKGIAVKNKQGQTITVDTVAKQTISIYPHSRTTSITIH